MQDLFSQYDFSVRLIKGVRHKKGDRMCLMVASPEIHLVMPVLSSQPVENFRGISITIASIFMSVGIFKSFPCRHYIKYSFQKSCSRQGTRSSLIYLNSQAGHQKSLKALWSIGHIFTLQRYEKTFLYQLILSQSCAIIVSFEMSCHIEILNQFLSIKLIGFLIVNISGPANLQLINMHSSA